MEYTFEQWVEKFVVKKLKDDKIDIRIKTDEYIQNKIDCLKDSASDSLSDTSKITYLRILSKHIHKHELALGRDLKDFTPIEVEDAISGIVTNSATTKRTAYSAVIHYLNWCVARKEISYNPCDSIDTSASGMFEVNDRIIKTGYMPLEDFYAYIDELKYCSDVEKMVYVLIRYGVAISDVAHVRWEELDEEENVLRTTVKKKNVELPIDSEFIRRVELAKECTAKINSKGTETTKYIDSGFMIKSRTEGSCSVSVIYGILDKVSKLNNIPRLDFGLFFKNRRYDFVLDIYEEFGEINTNDLKNILETLGISSTASQLSIFKTEIKAIFDVEVEKIGSGYGKKRVEVTDTLTGEVREFESLREMRDQSKEMYGFQVDKGLASKCCKGERPNIKHLTFRYLDE